MYAKWKHLGALASTLLLWKRNNYCIFCVCVCSLRYPAYKSHAPFYVLICGLSCSDKYFHINTKRAWYSEKRYLLNIKYIFKFLYIIWDIFHYKKYSAMQYHKSTHGVHVKYCHSCQMLMKLQLLWRILEKSSFVEYKNVAFGIRTVPCGRTDRQKEIEKK